MTELRSRYPGLRPFDPSESAYFFGRTEEVKDVCRLLDLDKLTILHGPSGMGKSSLINAGILPALGKIRNWELPTEVVKVRFTNYDPTLARIRNQKGNTIDSEDELLRDPVERFISACLGEDHQWEAILPMPTPSLWLTAKQMWVDKGMKPMRMIFILDQFEELFTYPEERVEEFARQLSDIYHQSMPEPIRKGLERKEIIEAESDKNEQLKLSPKEAQLLAKIEEPLDVKILVSMRSDKLHFLERLKGFLPEMMLNSYELRSFDLKQSRSAILQPAGLAGEDFISPNFHIPEEVLDTILGFLQDKNTGRIDPSQLQIVCQHLEKKIIEKEDKQRKEDKSARKHDLLNSLSLESKRKELWLEMEDIDELDTVLRTYYLSQIKSLERRRERKLARKLIENHLVLPKSRQRTSKDAAYIEEVLGIEPILLGQLEESRLIRRLSNRGTNPIYEVSHDTLVEPILAGRRDREAIARFVKKSWKYAAIILLFWFLLGMLFESMVQWIPNLFQQNKTVEMTTNKQMLDINKNQSSFVYPMDVVVQNYLKPSDTLKINIPFSQVDIARLLAADSTNTSMDTIAIQLLEAIYIPIYQGASNNFSHRFRDAIVPFAIRGEDGKRIYAKVTGDLNLNFSGTDNARTDFFGLTRGIPDPIEMNLGDTSVQAAAISRSVPVNVELNLVDMFTDDREQDFVKNYLKDRPIKLSYQVNVGASNIKAPPPRIQYQNVEGIELKYSDGSSRFIPGVSGEGNANPSAQSPRGLGAYHRVAPGETLFSIARAYGLVDSRGNTSTTQLKQLNGIKGNNISVGQVLRIP